MRALLAVVTALGVLAFRYEATYAAEIGDVNGDGRVSYADSFLYKRCVRDLDCIDFAPGSADFAAVFPCSYAGFPGYHIPELLYEEALRRLVADPLPHFLEKWPTPSAQAEPPPADGRVAVEVLPAVHTGGGSTVIIEVRITASTPVAGLHLALEVDGIDLAAPRPPTYDPSDDPSATFFTSPEYHLLTHGRLAAYRSKPHDTVLAEDGEAVFPLKLELPRGTAPGTYEVRIADAEAVTPGHEVLRPGTIAGSLTLRDPVSEGSGQPFPPLQLSDGDPRRVLGKVEYRITDAEGFPGDEVSVRVQVRTERPINLVPFSLNFNGIALFITEVRPLYADPVAGAVVDDNYHVVYFNRSPRIDSLAWMWFRLEWGGWSPYDLGHEQGSAHYLSPLEEWLDVLEIRLRIEPDAAGLGEVKFNLFHQEPYVPMFIPYVSPRDIWGQGDCRVDGHPWNYEPTVFHPGKVRVLGPGDPPPPPPPPVDPDIAGIFYTLGRAEGKPGEVVRVPIELETAVELYQLRLVLGFDSSQLELEGLAVRVVDPDGNLLERVLTPAVFSFTTEVCVGDFPGRTCEPGFPFLGILHGEPRDQVPPAVLIADLMTAYLFAIGTGGKRTWEPGTLHEVGAAIFRIREDAEPGVTEVSGIEATWTQEFHADPIRSVTSGYPTLVDGPLLRADVPALEVYPGRVTVLGISRPFLRADSNRDGKVDLSDAVRTLGTLFQGNEPLSCLDAADANDDGRTDISDAIYTLSHLFTGGPAPPAPFPQEGEDPTADPLGCGR